jgi:hypothetical protein
MKIVADTMVWVSYCTLKTGYRHRLIERARRLRVRFFVSDYILHELEETLVEDLGQTKRYAFWQVELSFGSPSSSNCLPFLNDLCQGTLRTTRLCRRRCRQKRIIS